MKLYKTRQGIIIQINEEHYILQDDWDSLINMENLYDALSGKLKQAQNISREEAHDLCVRHLLPPVSSQEVWAAGVTYLRSRDARREESKAAGGGDFYDKVYDAKRPELFFKSMPHRVAGHGQTVFIRDDSTWNVPEPELTLFINSKGKIQGYTIGNDMSSRSIEGENPLYLPQAKVYEGSAALGPCLYVPEWPVSPDTTISMTISRKDQVCFNDSITISMMKRSPGELADYLYHGFHFPQGCFLMTGTCLVPDNEFTLQENDVVDIRIDGIGTLTNTVEIFRK